ncbi:MAG: diacylglycerol kinase [Betaproteobacteria bacterium]|nr:diacylglycerol kinase [Betaproteobacteria bacterium]
MNEKESPGAAGYHPLRKIRTAFAGIWHAVFRDFTVRYKLLVSLVFLAIAGIYETLFHFLFVLAVTGVMLATEILNSAIEALCDVVQPKYDVRIKHIKDMAAGATFIAIVVWYIVLGVVLYELVAAKDLFGPAGYR